MEVLLKVANERKIDIAPLRDHALLLKRKIYQVQVKLEEKVFRIKKAEDRLQDILIVATTFKDRTLEIADILQGQMTWLETNTERREKIAEKCPKKLQIEYDIVNFSSRAAERLMEVVERTTNKCAYFFRKMLITHNKCLTPSAQRL